jgi:hypothetical protein
MGQISQPHRAQVRQIVEKAVKVWEWQIGSDVNPQLVGFEVLDEVYEAMREEIRLDLDGVAKRVGTMGYSETYLRGSYFPELWKALSATGVFLDFEDGYLVPATTKHLIARLFKDDQDARILYNRWHKRNKEGREVKQAVKHDNQTVWNLEIAQAMQAVATKYITEPTGSAKEVMAQMAVGLNWFVGRRPWSELCLTADFHEVEGPSWADGWLLFSGHAKRTRKEITGEVPEIVFEIPIHGITASEFLKAFRRFRSLQASEPWFQPENRVDGHCLVKAALNYSTRKLIKGGEMGQAFQPVIDAGYDYDFTMHKFRDLYISYGQFCHKQSVMRSGDSLMRVERYGKKYLGHFGLQSGEDTGDYLRLEFLGDQPIPSRN